MRLQIFFLKKVTVSVLGLSFAIAVKNRKKVVVITRLYTEFAPVVHGHPLINFFGSSCMGLWLGNLRFKCNKNPAINNSGKKYDQQYIACCSKKIVIACGQNK